MGRNTFDAFCETCQKGVVIFIGDQSKCPHCGEKIETKPVVLNPEGAGVVSTKGKEMRNSTLVNQ